MIDGTLIKVSYELHELLKNLKFNERESYNDVIVRALKIAEPKLKEAKEHVEKMQIV